MVLFAVVLRTTPQHVVVLTYADPWSRALSSFGHGSLSRQALGGVRFDDVRISIRARQPQSAARGRLMEFGRPPFTLFT
eukprot:5886355-Lingulodinium_polyedra.AAC.1